MASRANSLLIQTEYAVWTGAPIYTDFSWPYDAKQMTSEYAEWPFRVGDLEGYDGPPSNPFTQ